MTNLVNSRLLLKIGIMMVVVAVVIAQASMSTRADDDDDCEDVICELVYEHHTEMHDEHVKLLRKLNKIKEACENGGGNGDCPTCCDAWDKLLTTNRFELVMNGTAMRDNETCLVWDLDPSPAGALDSWPLAIQSCLQKTTGDRRGWRLPTIEELLTMVDHLSSNPAVFRPDLFPKVLEAFYWSSTSTPNFIPPTDPKANTHAWGVNFTGGSLTTGVKSDNVGLIWCVRGGQGHDAY